MRDISYHSLDKSVADHHKRIDRLEKKPQRGPAELPWAVASFYGEVTTTVAVEYDQFVTNDEDFFSMTSGTLHVLAGGTYKFCAAATFTTSGGGVAADEVSMSQSVTAEASGSIPSGLYWPDFGMLKTHGHSTGSLTWTPQHMTVRSYDDDVTIFPTDQYLTFTFPFASGNCIISTYVERVSAALPIAF